MLPLRGLLEFARETVRDADLPTDPFAQRELYVTAMALDGELLALCQRLGEVEWETDPRYAEHVAKAPVVPKPPPPPPPPPPDPKPKGHRP